MDKPGFTKLKAWEKSRQLALEVYRVTERYPRSERFRLIDQMCRAELSVPNNIAESHGRYTRADQVHFLYVARGSVNELYNLLDMSCALGYLERETMTRLGESSIEVMRILSGLIRLKRS